MYYLNGEIFDIDPKGEDFFYGYSLFETIYGIKGKLIFLEEHLERLYLSAKQINLKINFDIENEILKFLRHQNNKEEFMLKIQVSERNLYIKYADFIGRESEQGVEAHFIDNFYQNELGYVKSGNYLTNILARKNLKGFEGVFLNRNGYITEGTISNLFFIKNNVIYTPSLELNILPGITREKIIEICKKNDFEVQDGFYTREELLEAQGIFFTNSLMKKGLLWVSSFENLEKEKTSQIHKIEKEYLKMLADML